MQESLRLDDCRVVIVTGDTNTGKTFITNRMAPLIKEYGGYSFEIIEVSDIVKKLSRNPARNGLDLLNDDRLVSNILSHVKCLKNAFLCGLREKRIYDILREHGALLYVIRVVVPENIIRQRLRQDVTDEKIRRDKNYDYERIPVDKEIGNINEKDYTKIFWYDDFREFCGLSVCLR